MSYGALTQTDARTMDDVLAMLLRVALSRTPPSAYIVEIGVHVGGTARGFRKWADSNGVDLCYFGIEAGAICKPEVPFEGANLIIGDSAEVFDQIPHLGFDLVFVDGCHCLNHAMLDTIHYSKLVRPGGFLVFHDTAPHVQQTMKDPHGPNIPAFHNSVNLGLDMIRFPWPPWNMLMDVFDSGSPLGGMRVYRNGA